MLNRLPWNRSWWWRLVGASLAGAVLFLPQLEVTDEASGILPLIDSARTLVMTFALIGTMALIGATVTVRLNWSNRSPTLELATSTVVGGAMVGSALMAIGLLGLFSSIAVRMVVVLLLAVCLDLSVARYMREIVAGAWAEMRAIFSGALGMATLTISAIFAAFLLLVSLGPTVSWDAATYHIGAPLDFLAAGRIYLPVDNLHVAFVGTSQMLNAVLISASAHAGPAVIEWFMMMLVLCLVGALAARLASIRAGQLAVVLTWSAAGLYRLASEAMVTAFLALAVLAIIGWIASVELSILRFELIGLGLLAASAFLVKYQALPFVAGGLVSLIFVRRISFSRISVGGWILAIAGPLLVIAPFLAKNWILFGAPFYPFLADVRYPNWVVGLVDGDLSQLTGHYTILAEGRSAFTLTSWIFDPERLAPEVAARWQALPAIYLVALVSLAKREWRRYVAIMVTIVIGVAAVVIASPKTNLRYLLPAMPVLAVLAGVGLDWLAQRLSSWRSGLFVFLMGCLAISPTLLLLQEDLIPSRRAMVPLGVDSVQQWLAWPTQTFEQELARLNALLADVMQPGEVALLMLDGRGSMYEVPVIQDEYFSNWLMLDEALDGDCLHRDVAQFIVWNRDVAWYMAGEGVDPASLKRSDFDRFAESCLEMVAKTSGFEVYRVGSSRNQ